MEKVSGQQPPMLFSWIFFSVPIFRGQISVQNQTKMGMDQIPYEMTTFSWRFIHTIKLIMFTSTKQQFYGSNYMKYSKISEYNGIFERNV